MYSTNKSQSDILSILECKELSASWQKTFNGFIS